MNQKDFDVVVIGGGAGGLFAASVANALGAKTCIIEKRKLGGDCTWFGCVPSKTLLKSASVANVFTKLPRYGIKVQGQFSLDNNQVMAHVRDVVGEIASHEEAEIFEKRGIKIILGAAQFASPDTVQVNGQKVTSKKFIISTGSHPFVPPIDGLKDIPYLTNETVFSLNELPKSLIVLGGGPIGLELSQALHRLGVKVSVLEMMDQILVREEKELAKFVEKKLREEGMQLLTGHKAVKFAKSNGQVTATLEDKQGKRQDIKADNVLVAVGRMPNIDTLALDKAGIAYTKKGITVNEYLQTTNPNVFGCGDAVGAYQFTHVAGYHGGVCVRNALFKRIAWQKVNYGNIAWATFTDPELAHVGMTEEEARQKYGVVKVYTNEYLNADRARTDLHREGLIKVITDNKGIILGAHIAGAEAGDLIQGFLVAKSGRLPLAKLSQMLYIYPTLSELTKKTAAKSLVEQANNPFVKLLLKILKNK
jgi:pyruvate/2-oxoglutarate dehydrogenase complex dihydrolipoamide dehydrogenase (E3) component